MQSVNNQTAEAGHYPQGTHHMSATTATTTVIPNGTWTVDPTHSKVGFAVKHMGIATVRGLFNEFEGNLEIAGDLSSAKAYGTVKAASVDTNEPQRDAHLRSADFFDADTHEHLSFESSRIEAIDEETYRIVGNLTLRGVTNEVVLTADIIGIEIDPYGIEKIGLEITGQLSRGEYGMKFNQALGSGNMLVADKIKLTLDIEAARHA
jgi:polyisoprenoid-binding protein YceI